MHGKEMQRQIYFVNFIFLNISHKSDSKKYLQIKFVYFNSKQLTSYVWYVCIHFY
jgi:hypothetical protein